MTTIARPAPGLTSRFFRAVPVVGRVIRDIERDVDSIFYLITILVTAVVLAI